MSLDSLLNLVG